MKFTLETFILYMILLFLFISFIAFSVPSDGEQSLSDVKNMIHKLYTSLNVDRHQVSTI